MYYHNLDVFFSRQESWWFAPAHVAGGKRL